MVAQGFGTFSWGWSPCRASTLFGVNCLENLIFEGSNEGGGGGVSGIEEMLGLLQLQEWRWRRCTENITGEHH